MATEIILLEKVEKLGKMGELVKVKAGYARNFLIPQNKALRATPQNLAYFESVRKQLEKADAERKIGAEKVAKTVDNAKVIIIRQASESGHLYGSVNARDISDVLSENTKETITRNQVIMNDNYKEIGIFEIEVTLHPEVKATISLNIARTQEEATEQEKAKSAPKPVVKEEPATETSEEKETTEEEEEAAA